MITDSIEETTIAGKDGTAHPADIVGNMTPGDEVRVPPFLERKYNLDILRRGSAWPWEAIGAVGTRVREPGPGIEEQDEVIGERVSRRRAVVVRSWRRDAAMLALGALLGGVIVGLMAGMGVFVGASKPPTNDPNANGGVPTATLPAVVVESPSPVEVVVIPATFTAVATDTMEPTATSTSTVLPTDTVVPTNTAVPTDTPVPTRVVQPTRVPPRPTNTEVPEPEATATEEDVATSTAAPVATEEPTAVITVAPIESPTPLPGILTPTSLPVDTPTEPAGPPTPLPGILTPTPEGE